MKKRFFSILLAALLIVSVSMPVQAADADPFAGTREVQFSADWSDLNNFVNGGRAAFDLILRSSLPQWLEYEIHTQDHDIYCTFRFSFESFADYQEKVAALILRTPATLYSQDDGLMLVENCTSIDLLNFLEAVLIQHNCLSEKTLQEFVHLAKSSITVNSETYELTDSVCIHPDSTETILLDYLSIETDTGKNDSFTRTITARIDTDPGSGSDVDDLEEQFAQVGSVDRSKVEDKLYEISVSFDARSQRELEYKTMLCLNSPTFISEQQTYVDIKTVRVERTEFFDLDRLLREGGTFDYSYFYPSYCGNLSSGDDSTVISDSSVVSGNDSFIVYTYERELQFRTVEIRTDLTNPAGKISRSVICTVPTEIAPDFHQAITDRLQLNLVTGSVLDIYDEAGLRYYEVSFSAWRLKDIESFTASVLDTSDYSFDAQFSWLPFGACEISDQFDTDSIISRTVPAGEITATYILPKLSRFDSAMAEAENAEISGHTISFSVRSDDRISLAFRQLHLVRCILLALAALIILIVVLSLIRKVKGLIRRLRGVPASEPPARKNRRRKKPAASRQTKSPAPRFCGYCGEKVIPGSRFCSSCGSKLDVDL